MRLIGRGSARAAAAELFARHNPALFNYLAWMCGNRAEAEDLAQLVWTRLLSHADSYSPRAALRTYLFTIGRHAFLDARRAAWCRSRDELDQDEAAVATEAECPATLYAHRSEALALREAVQSLPVRQREVVILRFFADRSVDEIAEILGEEQEAVRSRLRYAFRSLRGQLGEGG